MDLGLIGKRAILAGPASSFTAGANLRVDGGTVEAVHL
jgi:hypothetical protein